MNIQLVGKIWCIFEVYPNTQGNTLSRTKLRGSNFNLKISLLQLPWVPEIFFSLWGRRNWAAKPWKCDQHTSLSTLLVAGEREDLWHPGYLTTWHFLDLANQCNKFTSNIKPSPSYTKFKLTLYQMSILWAFPLIFFAICFQNGCSQVKWNCTKISECPPYFCLYPKNEFVIWESA